MEVSNTFQPFVNSVDSTRDSLEKRAVGKINFNLYRLHTFPTRQYFVFLNGLSVLACKK